MADTTTTRFSPTKPHFFKPLITPTFRNEILIPMSFFMNYLDGQKCEKAVLRSGHGKVWAVNINGRRIVDGWKEFVQDHDLHEGDFLVFRHEGNMVFDVLIFEPSACERKYPQFDLHDDEVDDLVGEENESSKPVKINYKGSKDIRKRKYTTRFEANVTPSKRTANPSFVASLKPSYKKSRIMMIPTYFSTQYSLGNKGCREVILRDQKQRSWPVELRHKKGGNSFYFGPGWHEFCVANRLKEGDSFIFELIKTGQKPIMNFHCLDEGNSMGKRETSSSKAKPSSFEALGRSCMFKREATSKPRNLFYTPGNSYFCGIIGRSHFTKYQMKLPKNFAKSNGLSDEEGYKVILRNTNGGSWQVLLRHQKCDGEVYIGRGWNEFALGNDLEVGDEFKIELVKDGNVLIMNYFGLGSNAMAEREMTSNGKPSSSSSPKNSYFCGVINSSNLTYCSLNIPFQFARSNGLENKCCEMVLRNQKGGSWPLLLRYKKSDGQVYIGGGWNQFAIENGLEVGDEFKIELVKGGKMLLMNYYYGSNN